MDLEMRLPPDSRHPAVQLRRGALGVWLDWLAPLILVLVAAVSIFGGQPVNWPIELQEYRFVVLTSNACRDCQSVSGELNALSANRDVLIIDTSGSELGDNDALQHLETGGLNTSGTLPKVISRTGDAAPGPAALKQLLKEGDVAPDSRRLSNGFVTEPWHRTLLASLAVLIAALYVFCASERSPVIAAIGIWTAIGALAFKMFQPCSSCMSSSTGVESNALPLSGIVVLLGASASLSFAKLPAIVRWMLFLGVVPVFLQVTASSSDRCLPCLIAGLSMVIASRFASGGWRPTKSLMGSLFIVVGLPAILIAVVARVPHDVSQSTINSESLLPEGSRLQNLFEPPIKSGLRLVFVESDRCALCAPIRANIETIGDADIRARLHIVNLQGDPHLAQRLSPSKITPAIYLLDTNDVIVLSSVGMDGLPKSILEGLLRGTRRDPVGFMSFGATENKLQVLVPPMFFSSDAVAGPLASARLRVDVDSATAWIKLAGESQYVELEDALAKPWLTLSRTYSRENWIRHASGFATSVPIESDKFISEWSKSHEDTKTTD